MDNGRIFSTMDYVRIFDPENQQITAIPAPELSPGMIEVQVEGIEGVVWVHPSSIKQDNYKHPPFPEEIQQYLKKIKNDLDEVYPNSLEDWEDSFRKDSHPAQEIALWCHIGEVYQKLTSGKKLSVNQKMDYFRILVTCTTSTRKHIFEILQLQCLSRREAEKAIALFYGEIKQ